jgi:hypothetical protein
LAVEGLWARLSRLMDGLGRGIGSVARRVAAAAEPLSRRWPTKWVVGAVLIGVLATGGELAVQYFPRRTIRTPPPQPPVTEKPPAPEKPHAPVQTKTNQKSAGPGPPAGGATTLTVTSTEGALVKVFGQSGWYNEGHVGEPIAVKSGKCYQITVSKDDSYTYRDSDRGYWRRTRAGTADEVDVGLLVAVRRTGSGEGKEGSGTPKTTGEEKGVDMAGGAKAKGERK